VTLAYVAGARVAWRLIKEQGWPIILRNGFKRVLIVGAGDAGEGLLREFRRRPDLKYMAVGFLDDDLGKRGMSIGGVPVLGTVEDAARVAAQYDVDGAVIAIPSAPGEQMRRIVHSLRSADLPFKTLPPFREIMGGNVDAAQLGSVTIEELLGREPVVLDDAEIRSLLEGMTVAVTGAAGSIGSELCRQVAESGAARLLMLDWSENGLFRADREMSERFPDMEVVPVMANITDAARVSQVFEQYRPAIVFHAAAHKHVPLMERSPSEAAKNNVLGTKTVVDASVAHGVDRFVLISTDKAVNPTSVMGMTKRVSEEYVQAVGHSKGVDLFAVRFGNVLGSSGSVVPIFKEQIKRGGPVTVTDPEMSRYFMTIPEAVRLVLEASAVGKCGEILVLDMGEPVRIVDLARDLIELAGLREPEDIRIEFVGRRPGEKLHEALKSEEEDLAKGKHEKVMVAIGAPVGLDDLCADIALLEKAAMAGDDEEVSRLLAAMTSARARASTHSEAGA